MKGMEPKANLMVVDDTPANLDLLVAFFTTAGFKARALPNGHLALQAARINPPDLILLDVNMPGMNGYEVCTQLKADPALKDIPVIFISALNEPLDKVKAFGCGGVDYVAKPFHFEEVEARVATHLKLRRMQISLESERARVQASYERLHELEGLRDLLVHMIVHDLRSPLHVVSLALETIQEEAHSEQVNECLEASMSAVQRLARLANTMLDLSKLEAGRMKLDCRSGDLLDMVRTVAGELGFPLREKQLQLQMAGVAALVLADEGLVGRVLANLLSNAIKHAPRGSMITVTVDVWEGHGRVQFADTGPGIPPEFHHLVFDKFGQVEMRRAGQPHTVGLGLTFCKLAVEAHGGRIGLESIPGAGSKFWFSLPLAKEGNPSDGPGAGPPLEKSQKP
jgi:signal transduction histidine kinase